MPLPQKYINCDSEFTRGQIVLVSRSQSNETEKYKGIIMYNEMLPINRALPHGDQTPYIYVRFNYQYVYDRIIMRGSSIFVQRTTLGRCEKCIIREISYVPNGKSIHSLTVIKDDGLYNMYSTEFTIMPSQINSVLIWRDAFTISETKEKEKVESESTMCDEYIYKEC